MIASNDMFNGPPPEPSGSDSSKGPKVYLLPPQFAPAIIGYASRPGLPTVAIYSAPKIRALLVLQGMTEEAVKKCFEEDIAKFWVGHGTPLLMENV